MVIEAAGGGYDTVYTRTSYTLAAGSHVEMLRTSSVTGTDPVTLKGNAYGQTIVGNAGANVLSGGGGDDVLRGLGGKDDLHGGNGAEPFRYGEGETGAVLANADRVLDFSQIEGDKFHFRALDADTTQGDDQAFTFVGNASFDGVAGQLRYAFVGPDTLLEGDTDGDGTADLAIRVSGNIDFVADDFLL